MARCVYLGLLTQASALDGAFPPGLGAGSVLGYCPFLEPGAWPEECQAAVALQAGGASGRRRAEEGMMLSFYGHVEELEWAVADASEAGRLVADMAGRILSFAEGLHLMLCVSQHRRGERAPGTGLRGAWKTAAGLLRTRGAPKTGSWGAGFCDLESKLRAWEVNEVAPVVFGRQVGPDTPTAIWNGGRCLYPSEEDFELAWNRTCDDLLLRLPIAWQWQSPQPCRSGNELMAVMGSLVEGLAKAPAAGLPAAALYPPDVAPVCESLESPNLTSRQPLLSLDGTYGRHTLSTAAPVDLLGALETLRPRPVAVNLGAFDGSCRHGPTATSAVADVANCAFERGAVGLAIEGLEVARNMEGRWPGVEVHVGYVSPEEASELVTAGLQRMGHTEVDLLKIDLDHADCFFGSALLRKLPSLPAVLVVEYNRYLPPPIRFRERFSSSRAGVLGADWMEGKVSQHWSGCSLQAWHDLAAAHNYQLLQATLLDLVFLRADVAHRWAPKDGPLGPEALFEAAFQADVAPGASNWGVQRQSLSGCAPPSASPRRGGSMATRPSCASTCGASRRRMRTPAARWRGAGGARRKRRESTRSCTASTPRLRRCATPAEVAGLTTADLEPSGAWSPLERDVRHLAEPLRRAFA
ncbi:unnamed protein product [Effrenium voratum]|uniref:Uncharacterized protein n=1 Tax=Effrenium voratum TaxID=2562239 RepID=A0AA36N7K3_9DINO|nr:unnamed protein product [Effrenium voratum]